MYDLQSFRQEMHALAQKDKEQKSVQVVGKTIEDALKEASIELGVATSMLEFEVIDKGSKSLFGKKRDCIIIAYPMLKVKGPGGELIDLHDDQDEIGELAEAHVPVDGDYTVRLASDGAYLKVKPPRYGGKPVDSEAVYSTMAARAVNNINKKLVNEVLKKADDLYVKVGDFIYNPLSDAMMSLDITPDEMEAFITLTQPGPGGADLTSDDVISFLKNNGIIFGIVEDALKAVEEHPQYSESILIAKGEEPRHGADARIIYNFEEDPSNVSIRERKDGTVNFKELNLIQNVVEGQPLARKIPPEPGQDGKTIRGKYLPARDGKDEEIGLGKNVSITDNGRTVVATANGQVMLVKGKITVETVMIISGDVNARTGNVNALGAVLVKGNVDDGYSITAQGNVEILGVVGKANISAGGDIIVKKGIKGGGDDSDYGYISAGKSVWASFIENAKVEASHWVVVSDGIVNSHVDCQKKVLCQGKRAQIVGGIIRAAEEVHAVILGSQGGTETIIEVGYDPKTKEELESLEKQRNAMEAELDDVDKNIQAFIKQRKIRKAKLSPEKEKMILELRDRHNKLVQKMKDIHEDIQTRENYLSSLKNLGKISCFKSINQGVILKIREVSQKINRPYDKPVTYTLLGGAIQAGKYEEIMENLDRR